MYLGDDGKAVKIRRGRAAVRDIRGRGKVTVEPSTGRLLRSGRRKPAFKVLH
jgi:hypothetical protein